MGFKIGNFNFNPPKISLPKFNPPKINLPKPKQVFGMFKGSNSSPKPQVKTSAPKPNLIQRGLNWGKSFVQNPAKATQRLQQKVTNKVVNTGSYIKNGTVSNFKKATNYAGTQFKRFENWADKGIKSNYQWAQQNRNSKNLINKAVANLNLGVTKVSKFGNDRINEASDYYRGMRQSKNPITKGLGYLGGGLTSIGRGLASPVTFADPRLSGKQRTGQVVDGTLSYIPIGKIAGIGGKVLKPITGQIAKRAPWLVKGGTQVITKGQNILNKVAKTKPGQIINQVLNRGKQFTTKINKGLNRNVTPKALQATESKVRNTLAKVNNLPNKVVNSGKANTGVNHVTNKVVDGNQKRTWQDFQGANLDETLKKNGIKPSLQKPTYPVYASGASNGEVYTAKAINQAAKLEKAYGKNLQNAATPLNGGKPLTRKIRDIDVKSPDRRDRLVGGTPQLFTSKGKLTQMSKDILGKMRGEKNKLGLPKVLTEAEAKSLNIKPVLNKPSSSTKADYYVWQDAYTAKNGKVVEEGYVPFKKGQSFDNGHLESAAEIWNKNAHKGGAKNPTIDSKMKDYKNYEIENSTQNRSKGSDGIEYDNITVVSPLQQPLPKDYYTNRGINNPL